MLVRSDTWKERCGWRGETAGLVREGGGAPREEAAWPPDVGAGVVWMTQRLAEAAEAAVCERV